MVDAPFVNSRSLAVPLVCLVSLTGSAMAWAGERAADRTGNGTVPSLSSAPRPTGVPSGYVLTHHGWFHPSCVVVVGNDEIVGADRVVRGKDGTPHFTVPPCAHARYDKQGRMAAPSFSAGGNPTLEAAPQPAAATYDGYIVFYVYDGTIATGPTLTTEWVVPPPPTNVANQDIAFFNDLLTSAGGGDILQPVLDFNGEIRGKWSIESEHCCIAGNDEQTTPLTVLPGDRISGVVVGTGCASSGVCTSWSVTTTDVTSGKTTTLNTTAPSGVPNGASPGSLETYGVSSCDMFPAGGETTFVNNVLTDSGGAVQSIKYHLATLDGVAAEVPRNCGYTGSSAGNSYTLIYGEVPAGGDAGTSDGGARDASANGGASGQGGTGGTSPGTGGASGRGGNGGRMSTGTGGSGGASGSGGVSGTGGVAGSGGASSAGGTSGSSGSSGAGGSPGGGGASGRGGAAGTATGGRSASDAETAGPDGSPTGSSDTGGCSCSTGAGTDAPSGLALLFIALMLSAVTRRASGLRPADPLLDHPP